MGKEGEKLEMGECLKKRESNELSKWMDTGREPNKRKAYGECKVM